MTTSDSTAPLVTPPVAAEPVVVAMSTVGPTAAPNISYDLFTKLDLRIATIVSAEAHPNADKLLKIKLDDGTPEGRQVCAGIKAWYDPTTLVGKQVVIVANLEPRMLRGEISQGMILAASDLREGAVQIGDAKLSESDRDVVVLTTMKPVKPGSKVS
jgi:tRNA-binding protein